MSLTPNDPIVPVPPALVQIHTEEQIKRAAEKGPREHKLIPSAAVETLRQWDEYRAEQQAMFAKMSPTEKRAHILGSQGIPSDDKSFRDLVRNLPDLDEIDRATEKARKEAVERSKALHKKNNKWYRKLARSLTALVRKK
jgi:hypothetical protein